MEYSITGVKPLDSKRSLVFINDELAFALYNRELRNFHIEEGSLLSSLSFEEITEKLLVKRAKLRAMNLLKNRDYSKSVLITKLKEGYYPKEAIDSAIEYVESYGYIDDYRYAYNYIYSHVSYKSKRQMEGWLLQKGVDRNVIAQAYSEICDDEDDSTELAVIKKVIMKKIHSLSLYEEYTYEQRYKLYAYVVRKGFNGKLVKKVLNELSEN